MAAFLLVVRLRGVGPASRHVWLGALQLSAKWLIALPALANDVEAVRHSCAPYAGTEAERAAAFVGERCL